MRMRSMLPAQYTSYSYVTKWYVSQHQLERTGIRSLGRSSLRPAPPLRDALSAALYHPPVMSKLPILAHMCHFDYFSLHVTT